MYGIKCGMHWMHVRAIFGGYIVTCGTPTPYPTREAALEVVASLNMEPFAPIYTVEPIEGAEMARKRAVLDAIDKLPVFTTDEGEA